MLALISQPQTQWLEPKNTDWMFKTSTELLRPLESNAYLWLSLKRALQLRDSMGLRDKEAPKGKASKYSKEEMDKWQLDDIYQKL